LVLPQAAKPAAPPEAVTLQECFGFYGEPEVLDEQNKWFCPGCKTFVCAEKKVDIWKVPEILVIQLRRFISGQYQLQKLYNFVDFPDEFNMRQYVIGPQRDEDQIYRLYAVSNHHGALAGGHYTAHAMVQDPRKGPDRHARWYLFSDSSVRVAEAMSWHTSAAYILFYERIPNVPQQSDDDDGDEPEPEPPVADEPPAEAT
jgi:ubiquitin carboxyl-terminal hydrolase 4/11/15